MNYVLVGNGIAALSAAESIRKNDVGAKITMISNEPYLTYYRLKLSHLLGQEYEFNSLLVRPEKWYHDNDISLRLNTKVEKIDAKNRRLMLSNGEVVDYDKLIIANGSSSSVPNVVGKDKKGVYAIRSLDDVKSLNKFIIDKKKGIVIGGGLLGLEAAWTLKQNGYDIAVVEYFPRLLPRQSDDEGSLILKEIIESKGIKLVLGAEVIKITGENVEGIILKDGTKIEADFVIFSAGIKPNIDIAKDSGIKINMGIVVDEYMKTSVEDIYAAGDIAEFDGKIYGLWTVAMAQGKCAGLNAAGIITPYKEIPPSSTLKVTGVDAFSAGDISGEGSVSKSYREDNIYYKLFFKDGRIIGAILIGDTNKSTKLKKAIESGRDFREALEKGLGAKEIVEGI